MKSILSPILYAAFLLPVAAGVIAYVYFLERYLGGLHHGVIRKGDVDILVAIALIGVPVLWLGNIVVSTLEQLDRPKPLDHVRQSALLYLALAASAYYLVVGYSEYRYSLGYGILFVVVILSACAVLANGLYLAHRGRRDKRYS